MGVCVSRAGTRTRFYSGDSESDLDAVGWYGANSGGTVHPVGQKKANTLGLYDMQGNLWQWCQDFYTENYATAPIIDPLNNKGAARVLRGGSWYFDPGICRSAYRSGGTPRPSERQIRLPASSPHQAVAPLTPFSLPPPRCAALRGHLSACENLCNFTQS